VFERLPGVRRGALTVPRRANVIGHHVEFWMDVRAGASGLFPFHPRAFPATLVTAKEVRYFLFLNTAPLILRYNQVVRQLTRRKGP
jgi:hypothetical protein